MRIWQGSGIWLTVLATVSMPVWSAENPISFDETGIAVSVSVVETTPAGTQLQASVSSKNSMGETVKLKVRYSLQRDASYYSQPLPDPVFGSNHATGTKSWLVVDGKIIDQPNSTDGKPWTAAATAWQQEHYSEAFQFIDLGRTREIRKLTWLSGDANHCWFVDVYASEDGESFTAVSGLEGIDHFKKWGWNEFPLSAAFKARIIKFRYRTDGKKEDLICFPSELGIYDGTGDEVVKLPEVGPLIEEGVVSIDVAPHSSSQAPLPLQKPLGPGHYLLGLSVAGAGPEQLSHHHVLVPWPQQPDLIRATSRFGLNASNPELAPQLKELGIGGVRFENGKWPFVSAEPHKYSFTGDVAPWHLNLDKIYQTYHDAGLNVLTYMFLTPTWASSPPADAAERMRLCFPPRDLALYGEFCFQMAARYGSQKHPDNALLTNDKRSGLGLVKHYEMWNEPNLNPSPEATWGGWAAPLEKYYEMMRFGAEAVKKADPNAVVTSAGFAGMSADMVDQMRTYRYSDGKCPLDFIEVINVHFYSGQEPPETCMTDGNANVTSSSTFPENLRELAAWRDRYAPRMPIWMTETGYDSAGSFGTTEAIQAARLPRVVMLCLANGVEKVFVYRESGSTPTMHACSGVLRNDFTRKPSWYTFGTLIRQFQGVKGGAGRLPHPDDNVWLMEWNQDGKPLLTAWTVDGSTRLGIDLGECTVTDSFSAVTRVKSTDDVQITPFPGYFKDFSNPTSLQKLRNEASRRDATKALRLEHIAASHKYLFDFGSAEHVGRANIQGYRAPYTPVLASDVWEENRGFGFDKPAMRDDDQPWMKNEKLDRDATRVRDQEFRFRVASGEYDLTLKVVPFQEQGTLTISGAARGPITLNVEKANPITTTRIKVSGNGAIIGIRLEGDYGHFTWIKCVETLE